MLDSSDFGHDALNGGVILLAVVALVFVAVGIGIGWLFWG